MVILQGFWGPNSDGLTGRRIEMEEIPVKTWPMTPVSVLFANN